MQRPIFGLSSILLTYRAANALPGEGHQGEFRATTNSTGVKSQLALSQRKHDAICICLSFRRFREPAYTT